MLIIGAVEHPLNYHFERGTELEFWTMGYLQSGRISTRTAQGRCDRAGGSISLIPPHTAYSLEWGGGNRPWSEIYTVFAPLSHWNHLLSWPLQQHGLGVLDLNDTIKTEVENALLEGKEILRSARPCKTELAFNLVERVLLLLDEINPLRGHQPLEPRVRQALEYVSRHFQEELSLDILARHVCLSPSRFAHLFRTQMDAAPMQYVEHYRLERAAEKLLSTNQSIEQIARESGFVNPFHFSSRFRRRFHRAPSRYRLNPK
jgi:AraC family transcriptional regulator of arabinose operon